MSHPIVAVLVLTLVSTAYPSVAPQSPPPGEGATTTASTSETSPGHRRMIELLGRIAERTDVENPWLGDASARAAREGLSRLTGGPNQDRFRGLLAVAEHELRLGNEHEAIRLFEQALDLLGSLGSRIEPREAARAYFRAGVAHLRHGETQNCAARPSAESCILPIRGAGIHQDPRGSRAAIRYFEEVLRRVPQNDPLFIKTVWLVNLAHMTLGDYPHDVPERYLVPARVFASKGSFSRFSNIAPKVGVDAFDLSGGAVVDDFDGDDDLDILTTTFDTRGSPHYFQNKGDGTYEDRTAEAGLSGLYGGLNLVHADYDNDGDLDLYVLRGAWLYDRGRHPNSLWRNDGHGRFDDTTFAAGLGEHHFPTQTAAWADFDNDGDVDLFVGNEHGVDPDRVGASGESEGRFDAPSQLFRNNGDGTFTDVASSAGLHLEAYVKGVVWGDFDNDRYPDLYVSVLGGANHLYHNQRDGRFVDVAASAGVADVTSSFPVWFWDYDNDGNLDLYVSSYAGARDSVALVAASYFGLDVPYDKPHLFRGDGRGGFEDVAARVGLHRIHLTMGANFGDLDNDGWLDFYLGTGYPDYEGLMPNVLYHNLKGGSFADVTLEAGVGHLQKGHGVAMADIDSDGDLDIYEQMGGAFPGDPFSNALYQNPGFGNRFVGLHLVGKETNRSAIGARIRIDVVEGGQLRSIHRVVSSGGSFGGNPLRQIVGVGKAEQIERVFVHWPTSDLRQTFSSVQLDEWVRITEGGETAELMVVRP